MTNLTKITDSTPTKACVFQVVKNTRVLTYCIFLSAYK